jgi:hypothetical protein
MSIATISYAESIAAGAAAPDADGGLPALAGEIDARLCSLNRVAELLRDLVESTRQEGPIFNLATFETRAGAISTMRQLYADLQKLTALVAKNGAAAEALHRAELRAAQEGLNRVQSPAGGSLDRLSVLAAEPAPHREGDAAKKTPGAPAAAPPSRRPVKVAGGITVDAVVLPAALRASAEISAAMTSGDLHYIPYWNHFAVRIGGCVLHANLGHIYRGAPPRSAGPVARETPERVKECRRARCGGTGAGCRYYHDPEEFAGSTDVRNFMADSWHYTPAAAPGRYGGRGFGSAGDLEADIRTVSVDEARRFLHQTAHDVLCAAILWQHVVAPGRRKNAECPPGGQPAAR